MSRKILPRKTNCRYPAYCNNSFCLHMKRPPDISSEGHFLCPMLLPLLVRPDDLCIRHLPPPRPTHNINLYGAPYRQPHSTNHSPVNRPRETPFSLLPFCRPGSHIRSLSTVLRFTTLLTRAVCTPHQTRLLPSCLPYPHPRDTVLPKSY